jgi:hypothetical protein
MEAVVTPRTWRRTLLDWWPVALLALAYWVLHQLASTLTPIAHVQPQLGFDRVVFGGTTPTVRLQRALWHDDSPRWYDYIAWLVYLSHFVVTPVAGVVLWVRNYPQFRRFRVYFLFLTGAGFVTYVLYPAIPPWMASERHDMASTVRVVREVWESLGLSGVAKVFGDNSKYAFPIGALPSLHAAWPMLLTVFLWPLVARRGRIVLVLYTAAMACTLVYSADHFVFDILLGWTYVALVVILVRRFVRDPAAELIAQASTSRPWR